MTSVLGRHFLVRTFMVSMVASAIMEQDLQLNLSGIELPFEQCGK
jgi:hypothetical protein